MIPKLEKNWKPRFLPPPSLHLLSSFLFLSFLFLPPPPLFFILSQRSLSLLQLILKYMWPQVYTWTEGWSLQSLFVIPFSIKPICFTTKLLMYYNYCLRLYWGFFEIVCILFYISPTFLNSKTCLSPRVSDKRFVDFTDFPFNLNLGPSV